MFLEERRTLCHLVKVSVAMPYKRSFPLRALAAAWEMMNTRDSFCSVIFCECSRALFLPRRMFFHGGRSPLSPKFKMAAQISPVNSLRLRNPCKNSKVEHAFPPEKFPTGKEDFIFKAFHLLLGVFQRTPPKSVYFMVNQFLGK